MAERFHKELALRSSPHLKSGGLLRTDRIMLHVCFALLPAVAASVWFFGLNALAILSAATAGCVGGEWCFERLLRKSNRAESLKDNSAILSGLLFGLTLPPGLPLWMAVLGGLIAIVGGKLIFGGLGANIFNPALLGRAFLQAAFPITMTTWQAPLLPGRFAGLSPSLLAWPFARPPVSPPLANSDAALDAISGATPLGAKKFDAVLTSLSELFLGQTGGSLGETCSLALILGGVYLAARRLLDLRIVAALLLSVAGLSAGLHWWEPQRFAPPMFHLLSGGLMLGAIYMATDPVTSPLTRNGIYAFGVLIGILVVVIRNWGGLPEGVMYAILLGNAAAPLLDRITQPRPFGFRPGKS